MVNSLMADIASMLEFVSADREKTWWFEGEIISFSTDTPSRILRLLQEDPNASLTTISKTLAISRSAIQKQVDNLKEKGYISRPDGLKRGWIVKVKST